MGQPFPLQLGYAGMYQDAARDSLPDGMLWNCVDFIPNLLGAPLRKRGGWVYASTAAGACTFMQALTWAPLSDTRTAPNGIYLAIGSDGHLYDYTAGGATDKGTAFDVAQNPVYHRTGTTGLIIIPAKDGATAPKSYDGTTFQNLAGTPPKGTFAAVWNDRCLLANGSVGATGYTRRLWFGPIGDSAATWDTTNAWWDFTYDLKGLAVVPDAILVFTLNGVELLRGTAAPSATSVGDLVHDHAFDVGCVDARSIIKYNETVLWADARGIYQSDGITVKDLTARGGMSTYWRSVLASYTTSYSVVSGILNDTLIVSVMNGTTFVDCLAFDLQRGFWYRLSNFPARAFCRIGGKFEQVHMALGNTGRVASIQSILSPASATRFDDDGTAVAPIVETAFYRGYSHLRRKWVMSMGQQQWDNLFLNYHLLDEHAAAPTLAVSYAKDPAATGYTALIRTLAATSVYTRVKRDLRFVSSGVMFKIAQTGASSDTRLHALEAEYSPRESSRLAQ